MIKGKNPLVRDSVKISLRATLHCDIGSEHLMYLAFDFIPDPDPDSDLDFDFDLGFDPDPDFETFSNDFL